MTRNDNGPVTLSGLERLLGFASMIIASSIAVGGFVIHASNRISVIETRQASDRDTINDHGQRITKLESQRHIEE